MTLREVFDNVIQLLNIEKGDNSPTFIRTRVVDDINAAIQTMTTGVDYFTAVPITVPIGLGTDSVELDEDILNVFAPIHLGDGSPLTEIETLGDYQQFPQMYLGYTQAAPTGRPAGYFVSAAKRAGDPNAVATTLMFTPSPDKAYTVALNASRRPTAYTVADLSGSSPTIPVAHKMAESILLPLVRWNVRTSHFFVKNEMLSSMEAEYNAALLQLGLANPQTDKGSVPQDTLERKKTAARAAARQAYVNA